METVYMVTYYRRVRLLGRRTIARLTGLHDSQVMEAPLAIFDTEEKAKDFIRRALTREHELNNVRRERGLNAYNYQLNEDDLCEYGVVMCSKYDEDGERITIWYSYESLELM